MKKNIHYFSKSDFISKENILEKIGIRGRRAMELASLNLPILPGFVIDADISSHLDKYEIVEDIKPFFSNISSLTGKQYNSPDNPMLIKVVISPNLVIATYPTLHNFGLSDKTIPGFAKYVGENFCYHEVQFLIKGFLNVEARIFELDGNDEKYKEYKKAVESISKELENNDNAQQRKKRIEKYKPLLPNNFFSDAYTQLKISLNEISKLLKLDDQNQEDTALLIQPMVYGNYGKDSASGDFYSRNIITGEKKLYGHYFQNKFNEIGATGKDINTISKTYLKELEDIAHRIEDHFKEIRSIRFTIENKRLWIIDQRAVMTKSAQADIKTLLDLFKRKKIEKKYAVKNVKPQQLNEILHPIINIDSVEKLPVINGGIAGAPGAAIGRVFFSTESLINEFRSAQKKGGDTNLILCMPATFAEDVKAIEVAKGVLSTEGGYAAHASVVARQYGKVSLVKTDLKISGKKANIGDTVIREGDYITLNVPYYDEPSIYIGKAELIEPDPKDSGLLDYLELVKSFVKDFNVRANADNPRDAALSRSFGASGIGLCRTEHMFFHADRINVFREMILSDSKEDRLKALDKLRPMQQTDFYKIFKIMEGYETTIRLLDAPLHEFLPHNEDEMGAFIAYLKKQKGGKNLSEKVIRARCDAIKEFNPMLGHRGCRIAVSYPEIYEMQVKAIFEAVYMLKKEGIHVHPEIMIPLIMNENELKLIVYGKKIEGKSIKGLVDIEKEIREEAKSEPVEYKIGTMIELPVAALGAGDIAKYAQFFSFGTNDLTQTTIGLSRDDFNSFMPDYTQFDLLEENPFKLLDKHVKELVSIAVKKGRMTRPDLVTGLCGEHGAVPENIRFCMDTGLNYVSCSSYSIPISLLAIAQYNIEKAE
ncbi:MAG: pyruvate, phosphate dikinase [Spirochaetes bacterium]|nr:MAG: pyruvate, phosphate dikinase [Spirochaetota bacterium]